MKGKSSTKLHKIVLLAVSLCHKYDPNIKQPVKIISILVTQWLDSHTGHLMHRNQDFHSPSPKGLELSKARSLATAQNVAIFATALTCSNSFSTYCTQNKTAKGPREPHPGLFTAWLHTTRWKLLLWYLFKSKCQREALVFSTHTTLGYYFVTPRKQSCTASGKFPWGQDDSVT